MSAGKASGGSGTLLVSLVNALAREEPGIREVASSTFFKKSLEETPRGMVLSLTYVQEPESHDATLDARVLDRAVALVTRRQLPVPVVQVNVNLLTREL